MVSGASGWTERAAQTSVSYSVRLFLSWIIIPARWTGKKEPILIRQNLPWQQQYTSNRSPRCGGAIKSHWRRRDSRSTRAQLSFSLAPFLLTFFGSTVSDYCFKKALDVETWRCCFLHYDDGSPAVAFKKLFSLHFFKSERNQIKVRDLYLMLIATGQLERVDGSTHFQKEGNKN